MEAYYSNALAVAAGLRLTLPYAQRLQLATMLSAASGAFLHAAAPHLRPGWQRMALVLPIVVLNAWLPLLFEADAELLSRVLLTFTHTWLANFKVFVCLLFVVVVLKRADRGGGCVDRRTGGVCCVRAHANVFARRARRGAPRRRE